MRGAGLPPKTAGVGKSLSSSTAGRSRSHECPRRRSREERNSTAVRPPVALSVLARVASPGVRRPRLPRSPASWLAGCAARTVFPSFSLPGFQDALVKLRPWIWANERGRGKRKQKGWREEAQGAPSAWALPRQFRSSSPPPGWAAEPAADPAPPHPGRAPTHPRGAGWLSGCLRGAGAAASPSPPPASRPCRRDPEARASRARSRVGGDSPPPLHHGHQGEEKKALPAAAAPGTPRPHGASPQQTRPEPPVVCRGSGGALPRPGTAAGGSAWRLFWRDSLARGRRRSCAEAAGRHEGFCSRSAVGCWWVWEAMVASCWAVL